NRGVGQAERFVDTERLDVANQDREQNIGTEVGYILHRVGVKVQRLALSSDEAGVEQRQSIAANLYPGARGLEACDDVTGIHHLNLLAADAGPHANETVG